MRYGYFRIYILLRRERWLVRDASSEALQRVAAETIGGWPDRATSLVRGKRCSQATSGALAHGMS